MEKRPSDISGSSGVTISVLMIQVLTRNPEVAQKTFDLLGSKDKELF